MKKVFIIQLLCPKRHAILGLAFEGDVEDLEAIKDAEHAAPGATERGALVVMLEYFDMFSATHDHALNPWCEICDAPLDTWHAEIGPSKWRTMDEAEPHLRAAEEENLKTREEIRRAKAAAHNN